MLRHCFIIFNDIAIDWITRGIINICSKCRASCEILSLSIILKMIVVGVVLIQFSDIIVNRRNYYISTLCRSINLLFDIRGILSYNWCYSMLLEHSTFHQLVIALVQVQLPRAMLQLVDSPLNPAEVPLGL